MKVICSLTKENEFGKGGICCVFTGPVPPKPVPQSLVVTLLYFW